MVETGRLCRPEGVGDWPTSAIGIPQVSTAALRPTKSGDGIGGQRVFNVAPAYRDGRDKRARVLITVKDGRFRYLSDYESVRLRCLIAKRRENEDRF